MTWPTPIDLHLFEINYHPFIISLNKFNGGCNFVNDLYTKICVSSKTIRTNVKISYMITKNK